MMQSVEKHCVFDYPIYSWFFKTFYKEMGCKMGQGRVKWVCVWVQLWMGMGMTVSLNSDGLSLLAFKNAVSWDPNKALGDWNETDATPCSWNGVSCMSLHESASGDPVLRVVGLEITGERLEGYIPSELGALTFIRRVNLHNNTLNGTIPSQLSKNTELHSIFLSGNRLTGSIPPDLTRLPRLQNLDLSRNSLSGYIPSEMSECKQLQRILLHHNSLTGPIPPGLGTNLTGMIELDLSSNRLNGSVPPDLGSATSSLNLSHNELSGPIPNTLGRLPLNVTLDLSNNHLTGSIPQVGSLVKRLPAAFQGNPKLCGLPLQKSCSNSQPLRSETSKSKSRLSPELIVVISIGDAVAVALAGLLIVYCYWRRKRGEWCGCTKGGGDSREWLCLCNNNNNNKGESDTGTLTESSDKGENGEGEGDLVPIDSGFKFELDELLRASAYVLGKSSLGIVYKVVLGNGMPVAVRRLGEGGSHRFKEFQAHVQAIGRIRHPNIVTLRAYYWSAEEKLLISDYIPNGTLAAALHGKSSRWLKWGERLRIAKGVAKGLCHLHEWSNKKYVHGDIKPSNILLDNNMQPYISDLGLGQLASIVGNNIGGNGATQTHGFGGGMFSMAFPISRSNGSSGALGGAGVVRTGESSHSFISNYRAPEVISCANPKPTQKWDVYSFGVVLLEMLTGRSPAFQLASYDMDLITWVSMSFEEDHPLSEIVDPPLLNEIHAKTEVIQLFHIALACVSSQPESRPRMKSVSQSLAQIGSPSK